MEVLGKIRSEYGNLSKANRKLADYFLHSSRHVIGQTAQEIGEAADVSPASVVRFVKKIGYSGLDELKVQLAAEFGAAGMEEKVDPIISKDDSLEMLCTKMKALMEETTIDVFDTLDTDQLETAIHLVRKSQTVYLLGIGSSALPAYDLFHKLNRAGRKAFFTADLHISLETLTSATTEDVAICFSYSGHTKEIVLAMEYASKAKIPLILVTRNNSQKVQELADALLLVPSNEHLLRVGAISSLFSSLMVATTLYLGVIQADIEDGIEERMILTKDIISPLKDEKLWK